MRLFYKIALAVLLCVVCAAGLPGATGLFGTPLADDPMQARFYRLDNGITVAFSVNRETPNIRGCIAFRVGSGDDPADKTGLAHYLEHLLFKGSEQLGTIDFEAERPLLERIEQLYDRHEASRDPDERQELYREIDRLSAEAGIDSQAFRTGALTAADWEYLAIATEKLHDAPIYMDDTSSITITEMKAKIRRINQDPSRPNIGLIVIDYLQLMTSGQRTENRVQEISSITRNLKIMAKEMNVPIIALSQLSRAVEKQGNSSSHRPQLSDLRDSGSIEQDADCVLFLYRDSYYASQQPDGADVDADTAECIVAKNRHGETSTVPLGWDGAHTRFMDVDFRH